MTTTFTVHHVFETDEATYWPKIFFDREYNQRLYTEGLAFRDYELLGLEELPNGDRTRKMRMEPASDAPAVVRKLIGDSIAYVEEGRWDKQTRLWTYQITPSKLPDRVKIKGRFWVEPRGERRIERFSESTIDVKVFGVGGAIESFIEKTTRDSYEKAAAFTNRYLKEKGL